MGMPRRWSVEAVRAVVVLIAMLAPAHVRGQDAALSLADSPHDDLGHPVHLPILGDLGGDEVCESRLEVQLIGCEPGKAVLVAWGEPGFCPPQAAGPTSLQCTGLLAPGGTWVLQGAQVPAGSRGGVLFLFSAMRLSDVGLDDDLGVDDVIADYMCRTLFLGLVMADDYRRFKKAYVEGLEYEGVPQGIAMGNGSLAVDVLRRCSPDSPDSAAVTSSYAGQDLLALGAHDPEFGGYGYYLPLVQAGGEGSSSLVYLQNAGLACAEVEVWLKEQGDCLRPRLCELATVAPGETLHVDAADCVGPGWRGGGWVRATEPMAVVVDSFGPGVLTTYGGKPQPFTHSVDPGLGLILPTRPESVVVAPLAYAQYHGWDSRIHVMNLDPVRPAKVTASFMDRSGAVVAALTDWVCAHGTWVLFPPVVADLPGVWAGSVRLESLPWGTPEEGWPDEADIAGVATVVRYDDVARTRPLQSLAYELVPELEWRQLAVGVDASTGFGVGAGFLVVPRLRRAHGHAGVSSEMAITNLAAVPGFTDFGVYLYDANGLLDLVCQRLHDGQSLAVDLRDWGFVPAGFAGSAVISATQWSHELPRLWERPPPLGLGVVVMSRAEKDVPGDAADGQRAIAFNEDPSRARCWRGEPRPRCRR